LPDRIATLLADMADQVDDVEQQSLLRRAGRAIGGTLRDVAVNVLSNQIPPLGG